MILRKKISNTTEEIDKIAQRLMIAIEKANSKDLADIEYARKILQLSDLHYTSEILEEIEKESKSEECLIEKTAVIKVLLFSTWLQRLYFIIRSALMGLISIVITFGIVLYLGKLDVGMAIIIGIIVFISSLGISRLFDIQIISVTKNVVKILDKHKIIRDFIINHL
jgi:hypothetical protein